MTQGDSKSGFVIAALGASAGGLEPLESFFRRMPADSGLAFVIIQHLAPDHASALPELLGRHTAMLVEQAADNKNVEPNHVYVIPPNATLTIRDGSLHVTPPVEARGARTPIDGFFSSLAEDCGENAVCIMLSGTGTDGTLGLRAIKEHGGMAMAQTIESAKYDAILRSAIATGLVDHVLPVEEMPAKLVEYAAYLVSLNGKPNHIREQIGGHMSKIHALLRRRAGHDFSQYKESTIARRLERRMKASQIDTVDKYVELLESNPEEADRLFNDLLIGVTQFFRDAEAFAAVENEVIPKLFAGKEPEDQVRICVVGCATGEEAYSIAILLCEHASMLEKPPAMQIFATDIDERALETARKGRYPASVGEHLSPERLARFFIQQDGGYEVKREIREICLFSLHSFIKDPPFSRLDLISCRNVMIYLGQDLQNKIIPLFHYALRPDGYLFLGPSESASSHRELFETLDKKHRIFQRKETLPRPVIAFPVGDVIRPMRPGGQHLQAEDPNLPRQLERIIVQRYRPACVTVRDNGDAVYFSGGTSRYLEQPAGSPDANVISMAREGLRIPLRTALHKAINARERVVQRQISVQTNGAVAQVDLIVEPVAEFRTANLYMIVFEDSPPPSTAPQQGAASLADASGEETIRHLEVELRSAREHAQAVYEELESSNEELKSANEEYQSTNEELETSKEELQSFNEELQTVNAEVSRKVTELDHANSDLQNFLNSTQIATIFLDQDLRVRNFTPAAGAVFRLIASDAGRPITDLAAQFAAGDLVPDIQEVLRTLIPRERQLAGLEGQHYQMRVLPYRSVQNVIEGVVLTFTDVTEAKRAELLIEEARAYAENIVETVREPLLVLGADARVKSANQAFYDTFHVSRKETVNVALFELGDGQWDIPDLRRLLGELLPADKTIEDFEVRHDFPAIGQRTMLLNARQILPHASHESLILLVIEDVTPKRLAEEARRESEERYRSLFHACPVAVYSCDAAGVIVDFNDRAVELWGRAPEPGDTDERYCGSYKMRRPDGSFLPHEHCPMAEVLAGTIPEARDAEVQIERPDGTWVTVIVNIRVLRNERGEIIGAINCFADITERKDAERIRLELKEREQKAAVDRAMREKEAELARVARTLMVGEMATYMAHEINQPLAGVVTNAEAGLRWLRGEPAKVQEAIDSLSLIVRDGNRASAVIRQIRSFVKNEIAEPVALDITDIIREALDLLRFDLTKNQIAVSFDLASDLPPVRGDRVQLEQVILNLAINASDAMIPVTDRPRRMLVSAQLAPDNNILVSIRDSGVGIEQQQMDRMYDAFFTTKPTGVGMGLSICLSIVQAHGGRIWATHNDGPGLTVQFTLPADRGNS